LHSSIQHNLGKEREEKKEKKKNKRKEVFLLQGGLADRVPVSVSVEVRENKQHFE
jgi:hypothetical protein